MRRRPRRCGIHTGSTLVPHSPLQTIPQAVLAGPGASLDQYRPLLHRAVVEAEEGASRGHIARRIDPPESGYSAGTSIRAASRRPQSGGPPGGRPSQAAGPLRTGTVFLDCSLANSASTASMLGLSRTVPPA